MHAGSHACRHDVQADRLAIHCKNCDEENKDPFKGLTAADLTAV